MYMKFTVVNALIFDDENKYIPTNEQKVIIGEFLDESPRVSRPEE